MKESKEVEITMEGERDEEDVRGNEEEGEVLESDPARKVSLPPLVLTLCSINFPITELRQANSQTQE